MYEIYNNDGNEYVLIRDIATKWYNTSCGKIPTTEVKNRILKNGFNVIVTRVKVKQGNNFMNRDMFAVNNNDISKINELFSKEIVIENNTTNGIIGSNKCKFYIIQKYPDYAPSIIKMGKTSRTVEERSREFNVYDAKILLEKIIKSNNEKTLIDMISVGYKRLGEEEFWVEDIKSFLDRSNQVLSFLPESNDDDDIDWGEDEDDE